MPDTVPTTTGRQLAAQMEIPPEAVVGPSPMTPLAAPGQALRDALAHPLSFPPLSEATVPGDRAAIAIARGVPCSDLVAHGAVEALLDAGVEPSSISLVTEASPATAESLRASLSAEVAIEVHDPDQEASCAMVGVTAAQRPLRINRTIVDADIVLPIGVSRLNLAGCAPQTPFESLMPGFSDAETQQRFRRGRVRETPKQAAAYQKEVEEAGWLMGVLLAVQVAPGPDDAAVGVFAGEPGAVAEQAGAMAASAWRVEEVSTSGLVIGVVGDAPNEDPWHNLARSAVAADRLRKPGGAIAVCCDLQLRPRGALRRLIDAADLGRVEAKLGTDGREYGWAALQLARVLARGPMYLQSELPQSDVEALGMTPISNPGELQRLASAYGRYIVLDQAHLVVPTPSNG